ncbi:MAG: DUF3987 domain-containing protein [Planctomycetes bacterium]|nr:DUF3987 domain-containing protein [Planctomycetota bacterium]
MTTTAAEAVTSTSADRPPLGEAALDCARSGWAVFPVFGLRAPGRCECPILACRNVAKHPMTRHGLRDATKDEAAIRAHWVAAPKANVGIATGAVSGFWVLDVDADKGGFESLARLEAEHGPLPATRTVRTGGGGRHFYFRHPGLAIKNSVKKLSDGLDVRGDGGYVIAPPSAHRSGGTYDWLDEREPVDAPEWLLARVLAPEPGTTASSGTTAGRPPRPSESATRGAKRDFGTAGGTPYGLAALEQEARRVETTAEGARNDVLNKAAFAVGQLVAGGELDRHVAARRLIDAALLTGLAEDEARRTAASGYRAGLRHPRSAPPRTGAGDTKCGRRHKGPAPSLVGGNVSPSPPAGVSQKGPSGSDDDEDAGSSEPPWRPFPVEALPTSFAALVSEGAAAIGCDPSFIALPVLSVAAAAIGNSRTIELKKGWNEPCVVWTAIVGESGTHKSPAQDLAFAPLRRRDEASQEEHAENLRVHKTEKLRHEVQLTEWRREGGVGDPPREPERPIATRFIVCDATTEALAKLLAENPRGLLLARDELAGWLRSFDAYRAGRGGDAAFYLSAHGARQHTVDRKGSDTPTIFVPRAALSISGAIQPGTLASNIGREHAEDGLLARLLFAMPPRSVAKWTTSVVDDLTRATYARSIENLLALDLAADADGTSAPVPLALSDDGRAEWISFFNRFSERQGNTVGDEASALAKLTGYAARFALIHQLAREPAARIVDVESVRAGATLCEWFADEAVRVYSVLVETPEDAMRRRLVEWVAAPPRNGRTTARDLARGPREYRSMKFAESSLDGLVALKLGTWEEDRHDGGRGRPVKVFVLAKNAVEEVQKGPKNGSTPAASPGGDGDTNAGSRLDAGALCRQERIVSPGVAANGVVGAVTDGLVELGEIPPVEPDDAAALDDGEPPYDAPPGRPFDLADFEDDLAAPTVGDRS